MSPTINGCVICGYSIGGAAERSRSWLDAFRAVYSDSGRVSLSGVGRHTLDGNYTAPLDSQHQWDEVGDIQNREIPVMISLSRTGECGFFFHDACWNLLQKVSAVREINLERILAICKSLPLPLRGIGVSWGHDYGGLFNLDTKDHYPWEDMMMSPCQSLPLCVTADPVDIPEIPQPEEAVLPYLSMARSDVSFKGLPQEIVDAIGALLSTKDACSLAHCTKGLLSLLKSQTFWASRFQAGGEYEWFFERFKDDGRPDWKSLCRIARHAAALPGFQNRKRIWKVAKDINDLLQLRVASTPSLLYDARSIQDGSFPAVVNGDVRKPSAEGGESFNEGCQIFQRQRTILSQKLSCLAVSLIKIGNFEYVTGLRLINYDRTESCLGYINDGNELNLNIDRLKGILVAMGSRGVRALRIIDGEGRKSRWFGCPQDCPITMRLAGNGLLDGLEVGIDGYKLVSLATTGSRSPSSCRELTGSLLRSTALWYPTVPPSNLNLNDQSFTGNCAFDGVYRPLCWIRFGCQRSTNLRSLTGLSVTRLGGLCEIEAHYDSDNVPRSSRRLGRRPITDFSETHFFAIDGPGGEIISSVEVSLDRKDGSDVYDFYRHGKLNSLKVITNRDRTYHFQPTKHSPVTHPLVVAQGTTITGFYASQHPEFGLVSLGLISEVIQDVTVSLRSQYPTEDMQKEKTEQEERKDPGLSEAKAITCSHIGQL